jgi:23S rRNA (guanosine2251-2'-O)-methyltransferase
MNDEQSIWRDALERLRGLDAVWPPPETSLLACRDWMAQQPVERLAALARLLAPGMTRRQFWCALVPVERTVARCKVTDVDILDRDLDVSAPLPAPPIGVTVILDSLRSAFNVGGIFRTAECFGLKEIVLCGYTPLPDQPQVAKAALGTEKRIAWRAVPSIADAIHECRAGGIACYALETVEGAPGIETFPWKFPCALVLGNERFGLDAETVRRCDAAVRIPLFGRKNSLNVGSAFAIAAHELRRSAMPSS